MNSSQIRYLEFLRRLQYLENQGKSLSNENQEYYLEVLEYRAAVEEDIFWKNRR
jgi:hypothetical protein